MADARLPPFKQHPSFSGRKEMAVLVDLDQAAPQDAKLAEALLAVAHPSRLALLRQLRSPKTLREIEVKGAGAAPGVGTHERTLTRQTVRVHLDRCLEAGIVVAREAEREYGATLEYRLNHQPSRRSSASWRGCGPRRS